MTIIVIDLPNPATGKRGQGWWAAKCSECGRFVTKYAFTPDDARAESSDHVCGRAR